MSQASNQPEIQGWMKDLLDCPVCFEVMGDPPIYICENTHGHSLCFKCHQSLAKEAKPSCPICREALAGRRSLVLENMAEKLPKITCKFDGCNFKKSEEAAVKKHEESCENRLVPCDHCQGSGKIMQKKLAQQNLTEGGVKFPLSGGSLLEICQGSTVDSPVLQVSLEISY